MSTFSDGVRKPNIPLRRQPASYIGCRRLRLYVKFSRKITSYYDERSLKNLKLKFELFEPSAEKFPAIIRSKLGQHVIRFKPATLKNAWNKTKEATSEEIVSKNSWQIRRPFQREVDTHLLGEDLVSPWM